MSWFSALPPSQRWATALAALCTATAVPAHAQNAPARPKSDDPNAPVVVHAERITGRPEREVNLERHVELVRGKTGLTADAACYKMVEGDVTATGNVNLWRFGDRYKGEELTVNLESGKGWVLRPEYRMELNNAQGKAARIDFLSEEEAIVYDGTYSTCEGPNPDWYLKSSTLRLDEGRDVGVAGKTVVYFKGVPIIGTPAMSFSLSGARRSGWLPPSIDVRSKGGAELMMPYYVNIAPNRDLTLYPRLFANRGLQMGATGRYLGESYTGQTHAELLINDRQADHADRWFVNSTHSQAFTPAWGFGWNVRAAFFALDLRFRRAPAAARTAHRLRDALLELVGPPAELPGAARPGRGGHAIAGRAAPIRPPAAD
jgi:LPS-assembly protein